MTENDFISPAGRLATSNDEATLRTAVSRSYYGAFHLAIAFLADLGCPVSTNDHAEPVRRLSSSGNEHARKAARMLSDLQNARILADYRLVDRRSSMPDYARYHVELAHRVRNELEKCVGEEVRAAMKAAIEEYLNKLAGRG